MKIKNSTIISFLWVAVLVSRIFINMESSFFIGLYNANIRPMFLISLNKKSSSLEEDFLFRIYKRSR